MPRPIRTVLISVFSVFSVLAALLLGCAKVGSPTGGPVDKEPPRILSHYPERDALKVARDTQIAIVFSEPMSREQTEAAIFTSPAGPLKLSWRGSRLGIAMSLAEERTYVLTVGTGARDLRGNALAQSFTLAFATGSQLDQGLVRGRVHQGHQPVAGVHVWAYDLGTFSGEVGLDEPSYQTQSGTDGTYEFARLAPGRYRVLAFRDANRNALPDADEWLALPAAPVQVGEEEVRAGDLALVRRQVPAPALKRVQAIHAERLMLLFAEAVGPHELELAVAGLAVEALYAAPDAAEKIYVETKAQQPGQHYAVQLALAGEPVPWDSPVRGTARPDRKPPSFVALARDRLAPTDALDLLFSEAMQPAAPEGFWTESDSTQALAGDWLWPAPNRARFVPAAPLAPGAYRLAGPAARFVDRAGHGLADSLLALSFTVGAETAAIRGQVQAGETGRVRVAAIGEEGRTYAEWADEEGRFALAGLLTGTYLLWAFVDRDGDGEWGHGSLRPFRYSEPYGRYGEPIDLDAGQTVEEVAILCR